MAQHSPKLSASQAASAASPAEMGPVALHLSLDSGSQSVSADRLNKAVQTGAIPQGTSNSPASMSPSTEQRKGIGTHSVAAPALMREGAQHQQEEGGVEAARIESKAAPVPSREDLQKQEEAAMEAANVQSAAAPAYQVSIRNTMIQQNNIAEHPTGDSQSHLGLDSCPLSVCSAYLR
jgi:hypothetical protein